MVTLEQLIDRWRRDDRGPATLVTVIAMVAFLLIFSVLLQTAPSLVPGLEFPIVVNHTKPTERVTNPGGIG
ncbi:MAG: hypothetical protein EOP16_03150 [Pseudonocardia sp.]|nr:MAG: hypothetical protein EOP16_03150 [Pseudonocardia sp.]